MGLVFLILVGGIVGWLTSIVTHMEDGRSLKVNSVAGICGALLAGLVLTPVVGEGNLLHGPYNVVALLLSLLGSIGGVALANFVRERRTA